VQDRRQGVGRDLVQPGCPQALQVTSGPGPAAWSCRRRPACGHPGTRWPATSRPCVGRPSPPPPSFLPRRWCQRGVRRATSLAGRAFRRVLPVFETGPLASSVHPSGLPIVAHRARTAGTVGACCKRPLADGAGVPKSRTAIFGWSSQEGVRGPPGGAAQEREAGHAGTRVAAPRCPGEAAGPRRATCPPAGGLQAGRAGLPHPDCQGGSKAGPAPVGRPRGRGIPGTPGLGGRSGEALWAVRQDAEALASEGSFHEESR